MIARQLGSLFVWYDSEEALLRDLSTRALEKCDFCFSRVVNKYYFVDGQPRFDPFHSGQYTFFLYQLSHLAWKEAENTSLAARLYYLNKALNGLDLFYEVEMPAVWTCDHPVGSVIGRATFTNRLFFLQNITVGNNKGYFPILEDGVTLMSGSSVLGRTRVGSGVVVSANCLIKDEIIPENSLVFGSSPNLVVKPMAGDMKNYRDSVWRSP